MKFSEDIKTLRYKIMLSQQQFEEKHCVSFTTVNR